MNPERYAFIEQYKDFRVDVPVGQDGIWEVRRKEMTQRDVLISNAMATVTKTDRYSTPGIYTQLIRWGKNDDPYSETVVMSDHIPVCSKNAALPLQSLHRRSSSIGLERKDMLCPWMHQPALSLALCPLLRAPPVGKECEGEMNTLVCICCGKPLTGGLDTFGDVGQEMCWDDWSTLVFDPPDPYLDLRELMADEFPEYPDKKLDDELL